MANSTNTLDLSPVSRFPSRRADACPRIIAALVAAVVFFAALGSARARSDGPSREWSDAGLVQATPSAHSLAAHASDQGLRTQRRPSPHFEVPLVDASQRPRSHQFRPTRRPRRARTESRPLPSADTTQQRLPCPDVGRSPRASAQPPSHLFTHEAIALHTRRRLATGDLLCRTFSLPQCHRSRRPK